MKDWIKKHKIKLLIISGITIGMILSILGMLWHIDMDSTPYAYACAFPVWLLSLPGVFLWGRKIKKKRPTISRIIQICSMYFLIAFGVMYFLLIIGVIPTK